MAREEECGLGLALRAWGGGKNRGFFAMPIGDTVWIEFEAGDPMRPIWAGTFWGAPESGGGEDDLAKESGAETPEGPDAAPKPGHHVLRTTAGHLISLDDEGGVIVIAEASGAEVRITGDGEVIVTADKINGGLRKALVLGEASKTLSLAHSSDGVGPAGPRRQQMSAAISAKFRRGVTMQLVPALCRSRSIAWFRAPDGRFRMRRSRFGQALVGGDCRMVGLAMAAEFPARPLGAKEPLKR